MARRLMRLGLDGFFTSQVADADELVRPARVVVGHRDMCTVDDGIDHVRVALKAGESVVAGDWVLVRPGGPRGLHLLHRRLERRSLLARRATGDVEEAQGVAANVDVVFLVEAFPAPINVHRLERGLALAWEAGARPVIVLTKADLADDPGGTLDDLAGRLGAIDIVLMRPDDTEGLACLQATLPEGASGVLLGPSGAGKSTLVNALAGHDTMRTAQVRRDGKGRHTTVHRELVELPWGAVIIDTPGIRQLGVWAGQSAVDATFDDVTQVANQCRFADCHHEGEPGCAVQAALADGSLSADRLAHWQALRREVAWQARRLPGLEQRLRRQQDRAVMRAHEVHMRNKHR
ncbi:MAG: ribosome small subunit-dependent GTPase A [Cytophagaceae bacterium]|nr:ribosome small subunit-dependent GTPase A [Gemmatimonadaceae bacterium]